MSDELYRKNAEQCVENIRFYPIEEKESAYKQSIIWYSHIQNKTVDDMRAIATRYGDLAIIYFNRGGSDLAHYKQAGHYYSQSIQQRQQMALDDANCRELTELYIDLSDVFICISEGAAAEDAMGNAIKAFNMIIHKNPAELAIGDPKKNFLEFRGYFEKQTSTPAYLASAKYKNHEQILLARQNEQSMASMMDDLSFVKESPIEVGSIDQMMGGLIISNEALPNFTPINLDRPSSDVDYRCIAIEYLRLTQQHAKQNNLSDTIITYQQAWRPLQEIKCKNANDLATISQIEEQIDCLRAQVRTSHTQSTQKPSRSLPFWHQNTQVADSLISKIRLFESGTTPTANPTQASSDTGLLEPML